MIKVKKDLTGMKFGRLTVLKQTEDIKIGNRFYAAWLVQCDCGSKSFPIAGQYLTSKKGVKSCGCLRKGILDGKVSVRKNLIGKRFGRLVVLEQVEDYILPSNRRIARWKCQCDCGNTHIATSWDLTSGDTTSCGCYRKECELSNLKPYNYQKLYNNYDLESEEYGIGYTNKGEPFWFDKEDYNLIKDYCWGYNKDGYVVSTDNNHKHIKLHRLVMNACNGDVVDHKKHLPRKEPKLDNRKSNLRITTHQGNAMNMSKSKANTSGVTGVYWHSQHQKWKAAIGYKRKQIHLGYFDNFEDAVRVRKEAEEKYFGEYSFDNSQKDK